MEDANQEKTYCQCYRCEAGCIHVVCGPVMVRLTPSQFVELSEAVKELTVRLKHEAGNALVC